MKVTIKEINLKRLIKAINHYLILSEKAIKEAEIQSKKNNTLYNGNLIRFHDSYIKDIIKDLERQLEEA